jgi:hypothetical protein
MFKNIIITILVIVAILLWLVSDPDSGYDDSDDITIEYKCSIIKEYKHVPPEVLEECRKRKNVTEDVDSKTSV